MSPHLEQLNRDFETFYEFCKDNNLTDDDVKKLCEPLLRTVRKTRLIIHLKICILSMFLLLILYVICSSETASWHLSAIGRICMIKLLPLYDWTQLRNEQCLIKRAASENFEKISYDCVFCETGDEIAVFDEADAAALYDNYVKLHVPFVIAKATAQWTNISRIPIANLTQLLLDNEILAHSYPCKLSTNLHKGDEELRMILAKTTEQFERYFIHFQNCEWQAVKQFRVFAPRPWFLYREIAPIQYSWLLINRNYNVTRFKRIELKENIAVVVQVLGGTILRLSPQAECQFDCYTLDIELKENEAVVLTSLWNLEYKPVAEGENVAVILETH